MKTVAWKCAGTVEWLDCRCAAADRQKSSKLHALTGRPSVHRFINLVLCTRSSDGDSKFTGGYKAGIAMTPTQFPHTQQQTRTHPSRTQPQCRTGKVDLKRHRAGQCSDAQCGLGSKIGRQQRASRQKLATAGGVAQARGFAAAKLPSRYSANLLSACRDPRHGPG